MTKLGEFGGTSSPTWETWRSVFASKRNTFPACVGVRGGDFLRRKKSKHRSMAVGYDRIINWATHQARSRRTPCGILMTRWN